MKLIKNYNLLAGIFIFVILTFMFVANAMSAQPMEFTWSEPPLEYDVDGKMVDNVINSCEIFEMVNGKDISIVEVADPWGQLSAVGGEHRYNGSERSFRMDCKNSQATTTGGITIYLDVPKFAPRGPILLVN